MLKREVWRQCPVCRQPYQTVVRGVKRVYCSPACKQEAYRGRRSSTGKNPEAEYPRTVAGSSPAVGSTTREPFYDDGYVDVPDLPPTAKAKSLYELIESGQVSVGVPGEKG